MEKKWWTLVVVCAATFMLRLDITYPATLRRTPLRALGLRW
jgi:hypothetical protein